MISSHFTGSSHEAAGRPPLPPEELEMLSARMPQPRVEAGAGLMHDLESIPGQLAFKIGEAAEMVGVKQYVLRYWETEFEVLRPRKSKNNQRVYTRRDVQTAMMIKKLLYEDRFSIEGARAVLRNLKSSVKEDRAVQAIAQTRQSASQQLHELVADIRRLRALFA